ncbi:MAG: PrsW family intramembrane metalloprotease [Ignavibacteriae bacterium]|nr:PrsW family intramembrane metalloprotease [Ignavibacteriota bacterium]
MFLIGLVVLDSYKLVKFRTILTAVLFGGATALASLAANIALQDVLRLDVSMYSRYAAPVVEELLKAAYIMYLIRSKKIGFPVDAALLGFALGAGFAFVENVVYLNTIPDATAFVWAVRGFGTAIMHGGTVALFSVVSQSRSETLSSASPGVFLPGLLTAIVIHSFFNHFFLPPESQTLLYLVVLPTVFLLVFKQSERSTREWLGVGLDADVELLSLIKKGGVSTTKIGVYLQTLETHFSGDVLVDMLCYLRVHLELSVKAKALLLMRSAGFDPPPDPEIQAQLEELHFLKNRIGQTGKLLLKPFLRHTGRDLWQLHMLSEK